ncbi:uncharacterized protein LOC136084705 isoform X1 [Hydra vulgaris]|uniref:Uncharacterized protein LOC136084705 isoform X1 n=1 Tax=Hydra vulgaris TaxID=6087 RepID=A0ABM4CI14_HYDVU
MYSSNWISNDISKVKKHGKRYNKTNVILSSLLAKRRLNRRSKCPSLLSDVLIASTISRLKKESFNQFVKTKCSPNNNTGKNNSEAEMDTFLGMDIFFEKLKQVKVLPSPNCEKINNTASNEDVELQDLVDSFIETALSSVM